MLSEQLRTHGHAGAWIRVPPGRTQRRAKAASSRFSGSPRYEVFGVLWEDGHESLYIPTDGDKIVHRRLGGGTREG